MVSYCEWPIIFTQVTDPTLPQIMKKKKKKKIWNMQVVCLDLFIISMQVKGPISAEHFLMWKHMEVGVVCPTCSYTVGCCFGSLWLVCPTCVYVIIVARNIFSKRKLTFFF